MNPALVASLMLLWAGGNFLSGQTSPAQFLGRDPGEAFTPHHRVVDYCEHIAETSPVAQLIDYGMTPEGRPLQVLLFSSPENLAQLEEIRTRHLDSGAASDVGVIWLSYDVHGNEAVCTEAALEVIGRLADPAGDVERWLDGLVILLDPCLNPDGHERYVQFFQREASATPDPDPRSIEHNEPWPGGRYNHYLFDLNRDWAWLTQPESQARWELYSQWMPHVHGDFHEMGFNSPYYFPPAVEPYHEVITDWQRAFQWEIGQATASAFDARGESYYTDEDFDLFYPSYGDTYPMYHGAIGMTYEQGGSGGAGLLVERNDGTFLSLADRIENHVSSSLALLETSHRLREQLVSEFREYQRVNEAGEGFAYAGYLIPAQGQADLLPDLVQFLDLHEIEVQQVQRSSNRNVVSHRYENGLTETVAPNAGDLWIPSAGRHGRFLSVLMDPSPILSDSLTYDITSWALPYAHGLEAYACLDAPMYLEEWSGRTDSAAGLPPSDFGWMFPLTGAKLGRFLADALQSGLTPRMASEDISWGDGLDCPRGTPMFLVADGDDIKNVLVELVDEHGVRGLAIPGGMTPVGPDLGSSFVAKLPPPRVGLATGPGTSATAVGSAWWHFEQQLQYPVTRTAVEDLTAESLSRFDVFVLPAGWYGAQADALDALISFAKNGGWVIAWGGAFDALTRAANVSSPVMSESSSNERVLWGDQRRDRARGRIEGATFITETDPSHPLMWSTPGPLYSLQNSNRRQGLDVSGGQAAAWIPDQSEPLAGYAGERLTPVPEDIWVVGSISLGEGGMVGFSDDPLFRGFWTSGSNVFNQAVFVAPSFLR
jgi:hypothetical protein